MELVVVLAIAAVVALSIAYSIPGLGSDGNPVAADMLAAHLRYARSLALNREQTLGVVISVASNCYTISGAAGAPPANDPVTQQSNWVVNLSNAYPGARLSAVTLSGPDPYVLYFNATNGVPYDRAVPLTVTAAVTFASGKTVLIVPDTGFVRVQ